MYKLHWGELSAERFLAEYWQKKPLFIKGAFKQFVDPIDADELAGLAMEDEVESRIIAQDQQGQWQVHHGPFQAFDQLGDKRWSLLVQATNNWSQTTAQLLKPFKFMPNWRIDDVMVSYSTPEGGVGAHLDQYDVFIIQGQGKRHWRVGLPDESLAQLLPHPDLKQVSEFSACIDVITQAGDLLYIPPNHPHQGIAIEHALNFSVGFQAPNAQDLWSCFADQLIDNGAGLTRFADQHRACCAKPELYVQTVIR
jgi:50S ribosomal protein L16 3-hydroxylase